MTDIMGQGAPLGQASVAATASSYTGSPPSSAVQARAELEAAERFCREILPAASRTFAISIRALPGTLGRAVLAAYLICRVADSVEDEGTLTPEAKVAQLDAMLRCFDGPDAVAAFVGGLPPLTGDAGHARLVQHTGHVFTLFRALPPRTRASLRHWVTEMVEGMQRFVVRYPAGIRIQTLDEFREYCYYVAGTVGYLLTDLWHEHSSSITSERYDTLRRHCQAFGQALQAVNRLKDVARDAADENSIYLPEQELRRHGSSHATLLAPGFVRQNHAAVAQLIDLAWRDLDEARYYLLQLPRRALAIRLFCVLPLLFAHATLRELTRTTAMLEPGGAPKISRREVKRLLASGTLLIMSNRGVNWLIERAAGRRLPVVVDW
ncbi:MAG: phytoene/squalene synthase family protein [Gemmatimonadaceae bacterium]